MRRMLAFLDPWAFRRDVGYQITESLISVGSGGVTGLGLGDGRQKLFFLPEAHTDFILSIVGEELGLLGVLFVIGAVRRPGLARLPHGVPRARRVRRLPGVRHHDDVRAAGAGEHRRRAGLAADEGAAAAVHQLRRHVAAHEPVRGGRAREHLGAQPRARRLGVPGRAPARAQGRQPAHGRRAAHHRRGRRPAPPAPQPPPPPR